MIKIGGNAVAVLTQRLLSEKKKLPRIQVLIYPWTQLVTYFAFFLLQIFFNMRYFIY